MSTSSLKIRNRALWTAQILVALLFVFAGSMKFLMPVEKMQQGPIVFPLAFMYFIGICEILGGLGLILPGLTRIATYLTPLAAAGLTIIMIGATTVSIIGFGVAGAIVPGVVGALTTWIAYSRARVVPLHLASRRALHAAA
jgi:uncharacterized membrane protein YphA (DoxX/SURF4 family)